VLESTFPPETAVRIRLTESNLTDVVGECIAIILQEMVLVGGIYPPQTINILNENLNQRLGRLKGVPPAASA
jgi:hypothetical protein